MKKQKFNGHETDAPMMIEAVYENVHMKAPQDFVERISDAMNTLQSALDVPAGEMRIRDAAFAFNRTVASLRTLDQMMRVLRDFR